MGKVSDMHALFSIFDIFSCFIRFQPAVVQCTADLTIHFVQMCLLESLTKNTTRFFIPNFYHVYTLSVLHHSLPNEKTLNLDGVAIAVVVAHFEVYKQLDLTVRSQKGNIWRSIRLIRGVRRYCAGKFIFSTLLPGPVLKILVYFRTSLKNTYLYRQSLFSGPVLIDT